LDKVDLYLEKSISKQSWIKYLRLLVVIRSILPLQCAAFMISTIYMGGGVLTSVLITLASCVSGYYIQKLLLGKSDSIDVTTEISFENAILKSKKRHFAAILLSFFFSLLCGFLSSKLGFWGGDSFRVFLFICIVFVCATSGARCSAFYVSYYADVVSFSISSFPFILCFLLNIVGGKYLSFSPLFYISFILFAIVSLIIGVQLKLLQLSASHSLCRIEFRTVLNASLDVLKGLLLPVFIYLLLTCVLAFVYVIGVVVFLSLFRNSSVDIRLVFSEIVAYFPFGNTTVNLIAALFGLLISILGLAYLPSLISRKKEKPKKTDNVENVFWQFFNGIFKKFSSSRIRSNKRDVITDGFYSFSDNTEAYFGEKYSTPLSRMSYREIEKNVSNIPGDNEKILYAYKVMVEKLMASNAHVNASKTSREIASFISQIDSKGDENEILEVVESLVYGSGRNLALSDGKADSVLRKIMRIIRLS